MDGIYKSDDIVLLMDDYSEDSRQLHTSFIKAGIDCPVVVIHSDGSIPDNVISVYEYYLGQFEGKARYFNQIEKPKYWEISGSGSGASIYDMSKEKAKIFFYKNNNERHVKAVDWYDDNNTVRLTEHYNTHGCIYARTTFNKKGEKVNITYISSDNREVIVENYVTGDIILNDNSKTYFFNTKTEFVAHFMKSRGYDKKRIFYNSLSYPFFVSQALPEDRRGDVLFWQERGREDIPGNMQIILNKAAKRTQKIVVQNKITYEKMLEHGVSTDMVQKLGYIYPFKRDNGRGKKALICTNSDQVLHIEDIVKSIPDMEFNIVALTEMSSKLMAVGNYDNVRLYPNAKNKEIDRLFAECDYYLDINRFDEIVDAVKQAYLNNMVIFAFSETRHNACYVAERNVYEEQEWMEMAESIRMTFNSTVRLETLIETQKKEAFSENEEGYLNL